MNYRREIDGLRAVAVIPVLLFHAGFPQFSGGFVGVDIFFVISGFLITTIIGSEIAAQNFTLLKFYERRARRILPALFFVISITIIPAVVILRPGDFKEFSESIVSVIFFVSNVFFWKSNGYFSDAAELKPLLHTWSLAVEEQYYLVFPLVLMLFGKFAKNYIPLLLYLLFVGSLVVAQWAVSHNPDAAFYLLPTRGWELLVGSVVAYHRLNTPITGSNSNPKYQVASFVGVLLILYSVFAFNGKTPFPGFHALVPTAGAALILLYATPQTLAGAVLGSKVMVGVGLLSYSAYLWHQPLFALTRYHSHPTQTVFALLIAATFVLAYLSWRFVEAPFRSSKRFSRNQIFALSGIGAALLVGFGVIGSLTNGFSFRYDQDSRYLAELQLKSEGAYVARRFDSRLNAEFKPDKSSRQILLIVDSFAQDLANALAERRDEREILVSTRYISKHCGNLFLDPGKFENLIAKNEKRRCERTLLFNDTELRVRMSQADEIWLASAWQPWQTEFLAESVNNIRTLTGRKVIVFGTKDFGKYRLVDLLKTLPADRLNLLNDVDPSTPETNKKIRAAIHPVQFVDLQSLICGEADLRRCALFTQQGDLISHDGKHLTPFGAKKLGLALSGALAP